MHSSLSRGPDLAFSLPANASGILPDRMIAAMEEDGLILPAFPFVERQIQPASLDLRLGEVAYRVSADGSRRFDMIGAGDHGPLYAESSPMTFPVLLRLGSRLSQIRFRTGMPLLDYDELEALHRSEGLVDCDNADLPGGVAVSVDLSGEGSDGFVGDRD